MLHKEKIFLRRIRRYALLSLENLADEFSKHPIEDIRGYMESIEKLLKSYGDTGELKNYLGYIVVFVRIFSGLVRKEADSISGIEKRIYELLDIARKK